MARNEDSRTVRTRERIKKAFAEIVAVKELDSITVKEIAEKAGITRGTFYLHYKDVYDIIEQMKHELEKNVEDSLECFTDQLESPIPLIDNLYTLVTRDFWIYKAVINAKWSGQYTKTVKALITNRFLKLKGMSEKDNPSIAYLLSFVISGTIGLFSDWVNNGEPFPIDTVHKILEEYITSVLKSSVEETANLIEEKEKKD